MSQLQTAIIPDHCQAGIFIEADIQAGAAATLKAACRQAVAERDKLHQRFPEAVLGLTIAFGSEAWQSFGHADEGGELKPFRTLGNGLAPATQRDVMIHIQAMRQDVTFALAAAVLAAFGDSIRVQSETHGLRLLENRGTDGFVDGTENPQGDDNVRQVAVIAEGRADAGGSYVLLQKYRHDLNKWNRYSVAEQEADVGRSKADNEEFSREVRLPDSHLGRVNLKENGATMEIVRRSLPYGTVSGDNGLMFISYCRTLHNIEAQLLSMYGESDGQTDRLLAHLTTAVSGAYYYAPSLARLQNL